MMSVLFVLLLSQWIIPGITGQCMPPNTQFVMEAVTNTRAIIFGVTLKAHHEILHVYWILSTDNSGMLYYHSYTD